MVGELDVRVILRMPARRFRGWEQYFALTEPIDREKRADYRAASIREAVWNSQLAGKDRKPLDFFMLKFDQDATEVQKPETRQTPEEQARIIKILIGTMTGVFVD